MKAIAIDDEPLALEVIRSHAEKVSFLQLEDCFTNAFEALEFLHEQPVDLIFLDIKMPDISGLEFMEALAVKPMVVFTTAYSEHAVRSYELDALDYLLKPFSMPRFLKACNKAKERLELKSAPSGPGNPEAGYIFLKSGSEKIKVHFKDVLYIEAAGNYMTFVLTGQRILSRLTMQETLDLLPEELFARIHRSYIVAKGKVDKLERHQLHINGQTLPLSRVYAVSDEF
ncbi:LytTR family two component transcriptional regulator [Anseongella ginsenosidimutans]|uniref:LytTR family two component transcriptional regulator n=1 Tax=Anseongella ginsenosidimutans TaxID=496056 RepID=A0A4R3KSM3_9SPHI|nr:LytTR family DNA-binding domain-containing protein [Anseongella ginsenosidimutans]QEC53333.1 response regulator transcription factor [Anseongella ginsenosidimutans]TCS88216.1 LytTR family two component transcriptional regulator [Anseongella ginsenosidimutans]